MLASGGRAFWKGEIVMLSRFVAVRLANPKSMTIAGTFQRMGVQGPLYGIALLAFEMQQAFLRGQAAT